MTSCHTISLEKRNGITCFKGEQSISHIGDNGPQILGVEEGEVEKAMTFVGDYFIRNSPNSQFSKLFHEENDAKPLSSSSGVLDSTAPKPVLEALPPLLAHSPGSLTYPTGTGLSGLSGTKHLAPQQGAFVHLFEDEKQQGVFICTCCTQPQWVA